MAAQLIGLTATDARNRAQIDAHGPIAGTDVFTPMDVTISTPAPAPDGPPTTPPAPAEHPRSSPTTPPQGEGEHP